MTPRPRPYHRAAAERMLAYADEWTAQAGEPTPEASELSCLAYAAVHALLALHDTLTAADRYATNEAKQREEPDPLDENNHRDRVDRDGDIWVRNPRGCFHTRRRDCRDQECKWTCDYLNWHYGPLALAPEPPPDGTGDDLTASEGESGAEAREGAENAAERLWCPKCGHHRDDHHVGGCVTLCECMALRMGGGQRWLS